jgi:hypothetical protein
MAGRRGEWWERRRALGRICSGVGATVMALLLVYGLLQAVPSREAVRALAHGRESLRHGDYASAERDFNTVLSLVPNSAEARQGLACAFYLTGVRSAAALELTKGLEAGVFAELLGRCGHGLRLDDVFFAAKLGLSEVFAVPRIAGARRFEDALLEEPTGTAVEEPDRLLLGACLAQRAGLAGAAWDYAGSALETGAIDGPDRARFFTCFGPWEQRRAGCARLPSIRACVMTPTARRTYFRDIHLVDAPGRRGA